MSEYIKRDDVLRAIWKTSAEHDLFFPAIILDAIKAVPAADVRPVVRGEWEPVVAANEDGSPYQAGIRCSACGYFDVWELNYCPNCGARMNLTYSFTTGGTYTCKNTQEEDK